MTSFPRLVPGRSRLRAGDAKQGSRAPQVVHSRQRMQPDTLTFWSTFTPIGQRLRQRLHSTHSLALNRRWNRLKRLNSASSPPSGQKMRHQGRWMKSAEPMKATRMADLEPAHQPAVAGQHALGGIRQAGFQRARRTKPADGNDLVLVGNALEAEDQRQQHHQSHQHDVADVTDPGRQGHFRFGILPSRSCRKPERTRPAADERPARRRRPAAARRAAGRAPRKPRAAARRSWPRHRPGRQRRRAGTSSSGRRSRECRAATGRAAPATPQESRSAPRDAGATACARAQSAGAACMSGTGHSMRWQTAAPCGRKSLHSGRARSRGGGVHPHLPRRRLGSCLVLAQRSSASAVASGSSGFGRRAGGAIRSAY